MNTLSPRITHAVPLPNLHVKVTFSNSLEAELNLAPLIVGHGGVLAALEQPEVFRQVAVDSDAGTLVWPNGVDFCPDVLYHLATGEPLPSPYPATH